ncbi:hypothetical protein SKAU_G00095660 [Synaphobranchus kaupii]|uniref:Uncharacterized protein n=1 Tax=Synaphobranchus kaupii TaxID=118154 RepID=A0A9Q1FYE7_SYNKA|nr:hypothetical protein SKAU_G00095660 [Synaphobranchus kaupii]
MGRACPHCEALGPGTLRHRAALFENRAATQLQSHNAAACHIPSTEAKKPDRAPPSHDGTIHTLDLAHLPCPFLGLQLELIAMTTPLAFPSTPWRMRSLRRPLALIMRKVEEDEPEPSVLKPSAHVAPLTKELHKLVANATKKLDVVWPDPPPPTKSKLDNTFYEVPKRQPHSRPLPFLEDAHSEVEN